MLLLMMASMDIASTLTVLQDFSYPPLFRGGKNLGWGQLLG